MKKRLQRLFGLFFVLFASISLFAQQNQDGRVLEESFENGIPQGWTQEFVNDNLQWSVESGDLTFPNGAFEGSKRVAFRNVSGKTKNACTRLVSPTMDISKLYRPLLIFAHAQDQWTKDIDKLRVLYRLSSDAEWVELKTYEECITFWQIDTIKLVGSSKTYQIAFEATDNLGRGVILDDIEVRSTPRCDTPYALDISEKTSSSVVINWLGAFDAKGFDLKVSTTPLTAEQLESDSYKADVVDESLPTSWNYQVTGLVSGAKYYYYLRSLCDQEISGWAADSFEVANMIAIPYYQNFNMKKTAGGAVSYVDKWTFGASKSATSPFVNTCLGDKNWTASVDSTFALCFYGSNDVDKPTAIRGGAYAYAVLPETEVEDMSRLAVSFNTINWDSHLADRFSIIVGVMTDPNDKTTFKAVDTVDIKSLRVFEEVVVTFENYSGNGKFIAFMSDFIESNLFCMDNLKVDYIPEVKKVNVFDAKLVTSTSLKFDFELEYPKYEVAISPVKLVPSKIDSIATDILKAEIANHAIVGGLQNNTNYFVYARAIDGDKKGEWGGYRVMRTPGKLDVLPYTESFTKTDAAPFYNINYGEMAVTPKKYLPNGLISLSSAAYAMYCDDAKCSEVQTSSTLNFGSSTVETDPAQHLHVALGLENYDLWAATVFPELAIDIHSVSVSFVAKNSSTEHNGAVVVGVMSVANDISTFQPIDTIQLNTKDKKYVYNLDEYSNIEGQFWAFLVDSRLVKSTKNVVCIDDVRFSEIPNCKSPSYLELVSVEGDPTKMTLQWKANGAKSWEVRLFEAKYKLASEIITNPLTGEETTKYSWELDLPNIDSMYSATYQYNYTYNDVVNTNSVTFTKLRPSGVIYYYTIRPICNQNEVGVWSEFESFATNCYDAEPIPYVQNFDSEANRIGYNFAGLTVPCLFTEQLTNGVAFYNPSITNAQSSSPYNSLLLSKTERTQNGNPYVALPKMSKPINELQISFKTIGNASQPPILVGVMTDPYDTLTFELVESIQPIVSEEGSNEFMEYIVSFADYKGSGEHIALWLKDKKTYMLASAVIDDIVVDNIVACERPEEVKLADYTDKSVTLSWTNNNKDIDKWRVVFATTKLAEQDLSNPKLNNKIVKIETTNSNPASFNGLSVNTHYFVYVQSMCSDTEASKWSNYLQFTTLCTPLQIEDDYVEGFEDYGDGVGTFPTCYVVGSRSYDQNYKPHCSTTYKHTGKTSLVIKSNEENNGAYVVTNGLDVEDIADVRLKFWGQARYSNNNYAHSIVVGVLTTPADLSTFVPVDTIVFSAEEHPYEVYFNNYKYDLNGDRGKFIMFFSEFDKPNEVFIDDISLGEAPDCPVTFYFDDITATSFKLRFTSNNAPYQVKYSTSMLSDLTILDSDELPSVIVEEDSLLFENLTPYSTYYFYVRPTCDGAYGEWSTVSVVSTNCLDILTLPYFDNFDNQKATGQAPNCWESYYKEMNVAYPALDTRVVSLGSSKPYSGNRLIYLKSSMGSSDPTQNDTSYLVSREIAVNNLNRCQVSFYASPKTTNKNASVVVGVVSDIYDIVGSFVPVDTIILNRSVYDWTDCVVSLESYKGEGKHIAFVSDPSLNETTGICIDDVLIELIPTCAKPKNFKLVNQLSTSITLSFEGTGASKYEAVCGPVGFDVNSTSNNVFEFTDTIFTLTGLDIATYYDVYVRAVCGDKDKSPWKAAGQYFTIGDVVEEYPYVADFEDEDDNKKWQFKQEGQANKWFIGADTAHVVTDGIDAGNALYISWNEGKSAHYDNTTSSNVWAYRTFNLQPGTYTVSFDWTAIGEQKPSVTGPSYDDHLRVGLLPASSLFTAGSNYITAKDLSTINLYPANTKTPKGWIELTDEPTDDTFVFYTSNPTSPLSEQWKTKVVTFVVDEKTAGAYNMVFYWVNNSEGGKYAEVRSAVIDNLEVVLDSCDMAYDLQFVEMGEDYANLTWSILNENVLGYQVDVEPLKVDPKLGLGDNRVFSQFVETNSVKITGLTENTEYKAYIQVLCDSNSVGVRTEPLLFTTNCRVIAVDSVLNFDDVDKHFYMPYTNGKANTGYPIPKCFVIGHDTMTFSSSAYAKYFPNLIANTKTKTYSRSGDYALIFERNGKTSPNYNDGGYIVFPEFEGERENLQLNFWMRSFYETGSTKLADPSGVKQLSKDYAKKLTVGTMTDPNDPKTFETLTVVEYPYDDTVIKSKTDVTNDPAGNEYWVECKIPLVGTEGKYIAIKNEEYLDGIEKNIVYIDDVKLTSIECVRPEFIKVDSIATESVVVNCAYSNTGKHVVMVATDKDFTTNLRVDTISNFPVKLSGLNPSTIYYLQMQSFCEEGRVSDYSDVVAFTTLKVLPYTEQFNSDFYCPVDWKRANNISADELFTGSSFYLLPEFNSEGWIQTEPMFRHGMFSSTHMSVSVSCLGGDVRNASIHWMLSPTVVLPEKDHLHLVFDLSLTDMGDSGPIAQDDLNARPSTFMVVVSNDGGKTWKRENATVWGSEKDDYKYFDIPNIGKKYSVNLDKFAGDTIQVAFYVESAADLNTSTEVHIDNVHINEYIENVVEVSLCETEDYLKGEFYIPYSEMKLGENNFDDWVLSDEVGVPDNLNLTRINVSALVVDSIVTSICEGDVYDLNNFSEIVTAGVYKQKLTSVNKCDSLVVLDLSVIPAIRETKLDTICSGQKYVWNGKEYNKTGLYIDTLISSVTHCDSIVTLALIVNEAIEVEASVNICFGGEYEFGSQVITKSGTYKEHFVSVDGCDSIVNLTATVLPDLRQTINATIKDGEKYSENGFNGLSRQGQYTLELVSVDGCDSTVTLNLFVIKADTTYVNVEITTDDLPYEYETITYDEETEPGTYVDTIIVVKDDVEYVIIHTLIVTVGDAIESIHVESLTMVPNPLKANQILYITNEFTMEERNGLVVEVFDMLGQRVYADVPKGYPITVEGLSQSGLYVVRITTGTGVMYQGKILFE